MKRIIENYTFDASAKTITFAESIKIENLQLITNLVDNVVIYQFNAASKGGSLAGSVLTLVYDTTAMSDTDALQIIAEIEESGFDHDAGGRHRVSQLTTLFDGKHLNADETDLWHGAGTGTPTFSVNKMDLAVTAGQWYVRQQNWFNAYFSGKSQVVEATFENFDLEANVTKRIGYFSSSAVSPHSASLDGFFLENDGSTIALKIYNAGSLTESIDWTAWDNYALIQNYDWAKFTVIVFDFLWLGGTDLRLFLQMPNGGFILCHTYEHAGNKSGTFISSPNQPLRYEIRSTTGSGNFTFICGQVSTEGSNNESGKSRALYNASAIACNSVGTIYALKGIKKQVAYRDNPVKIGNYGVVNGATNDSGVLMLFRDPTLSAPLSYTNYKRVQEGTATNQTITAGTGTLLAAMPIGADGQHEEVPDNYMLWLQNQVDDTMAEYVIGYMPTTTNQTLTAVLNYKIY